MEYIKKYWLVIVVIFGVCMFVKPVLCLLILGTFFAYMGISAVLFVNKIGKKGINWTGNIIEYEVDRDGHKTPIIEFTTTAGQTIKEKPIVYTSTDLSRIISFKNSINQPVPILYDPDNPKKFVLKDEEGFNYVVFTFFLLAGLFLVGLSICSLLGYVEID